MLVGIETSLEPRADSSVGSGSERESTTSAQVRRVGGKCKVKAIVSEKYLKNSSTYFLCSGKPFGKGNSLFNHRNTFLLQVRKDAVGISSTPMGRYHGCPNRSSLFKFT